MGCKTEMSLIQAIEPGKVRRVLDFRSRIGTRISRNWPCFGRGKPLCSAVHLQPSTRDGGPRVSPALSPFWPVPASSLGWRMEGRLGQAGNAGFRDAVTWQPDAEPRKIPFSSDFLNQWWPCDCPLRLKISRKGGLDAGPETPSYCGHSSLHSLLMA